MPHRTPSSYRKPPTLIVLVAMLLSAALLDAPAARAQTAEQDEPLLDQLTQTLKRDYFSLGLVTQVVGGFRWDADVPGTNGFQLATARVLAQGKLDRGLGYFTQADLAASPVLLDARLSYTASPAFIIDAGLFKAPFSAEFLIPAPAIDFINRALVVQAFAPKRHVGVGVRGSGETLAYAAGVFNGNGRTFGGNDDNQLLYVARVVASPEMAFGAAHLGANVAYEETKQASTMADRSTERLRLGADLRLILGRLLLTGEVIYDDASVTTAAGDVVAERTGLGYQATLGYLVRPRHQVLARLDAIDLNRDAAGSTEVLILGYNFFITTVFELQVNYLAPVHAGADFGDHGVLVNFQIAF